MVEAMYIWMGGCVYGWDNVHVYMDEAMYILLGPPGCAQVFPLLEPGPPRFFWWYENSE
jgi:hypothetical protein